MRAAPPLCAAGCTVCATVPAAPRDRADWQWTVDEFRYVLSKLCTGDPADLFVELFSAAGNELCKKSYSLKDSAFDHQWVSESFYANPPFESSIIFSMLNKMLTDFAASPGNTRFVIVLPKWTSAPWWSLLRHFELLHECSTGARIFTAPGIAMFAAAKLTPAGDQGGPSRFFIVVGAPLFWSHLIGRGS